MPLSRFALYALSLLAVIFAARGLMGKPLSYPMALGLAGSYVMLLALGARKPRLQLFADVLRGVAPNEIAIVVRCRDEDIEAWTRALEKVGLPVTFSLLVPHALASSGGHSVVMRTESFSFAQRASIFHDVEQSGREVKLLDLCIRWHTPDMGRALRKHHVLWLCPRAVLSSQAPCLHATGGAIVAVEGPPHHEAIAKWVDEIKEARLTPIALN